MDPYILRDLEEIAPDLIDMLREKGLTLSTAESCTGGNIAHHMTLVAGCSDVYNGGAVTYSNTAKADILGLFMVSKLIDMGEITDITKEQSLATFIAGIVRSVRFGFASSHGKANMMCYNYMEDHGAFTRNEEGKWVIDFEKAAAAVDSWASLILETQATGNFEFAQKYAAEHASISKGLEADVAKVNEAGIPRDIVLEWAW